MRDIEKNLYEEFGSLKRIDFSENPKDNNFYLNKETSSDELSIFKNINFDNTNYEYRFYIKKIKNKYIVEINLGNTKTFNEFDNRNDVIEYLREQYTFKRFLNNFFNFLKPIFSNEGFKIEDNKFILDYSHNTKLSLDQIIGLPVVKLFKIKKDKEIIIIEPLNGVSLSFDEK